MTEAAPPQTEDEATVQPRTRIWVAIDFAADGPDAMVFIEELLSQNGNIVGWHVVNPANETDKAEFNAVGDDLSRVFEDEGPMESMFADDAPRGQIGAHLVKRHAYVTDYVETNSQNTLVEEHDRIHEDPTAEYLEHSHESLRPEDL